MQKIRSNISGSSDQVGYHGQAGADRRRSGQLCYLSRLDGGAAPTARAPSLREPLPACDSYIDQLRPPRLAEPQLSINHDQLQQALYSWEQDGYLPDENRRLAAAKILESFVNEDKRLNLNSLGLSSLPQAIGRLLHLTRIDLRNNELESLPETIGDLDQLEILDIRANNNLTDVPAQIDPGKVRVRAYCTRASYSLIKRLCERPIPEDRRWEFMQSADEIAERWLNITKRQTQAENTRMILDAFENAIASRTDSRQVRDNLIDANRLVHNWIVRGKPLTIDKIKRINQLIGRNIQYSEMERMSDAFGEFRRSMSHVVNDFQKMYMCDEEIEEAMDRFQQWYENRLSGLGDDDNLGKVELAQQVYQLLVSIHPFPEGNGRMSRMVMNWVLQSLKMPPACLDMKDFGQGGAVFASLGPDNIAQEELMANIIERLKTTVSTFEN